MLGISWSAVEDDGRGVCQLFDVKQSWNATSFPSRIFIDRYFKYGLSAEFAGAYTEYTAGKLINDSTDYEGLFLSFDGNCKYSFYNLLGIPWLDPYTSLGIGLTQRNAFDKPYTFTANVSLGANFWVYKGLGIQLQTSGKIGITSPFFKDGDYFQHSIGLVYKFQPAKGNSGFNHKQYKWTHKKTKFKSSRKSG